MIDDDHFFRVVPINAIGSSLAQQAAVNVTCAGNVGFVLFADFRLKVGNEMIREGDRFFCVASASSAYVKGRVPKRSEAF